MIIVVEGNISAGKSTIVKKLADLLSFSCFIEPATNDNPYLTLFYANPKEYALKMQLWFLKQRFDTYTQAVNMVTSKQAKGVILDRSIFSDYVFAYQNFLDGNINAQGFEEYLQLRSTLVQNVKVPDVTLFLDVEPEICLNRIVYLRGRTEELGIPLSYLQGLNEGYTKLMHQMKEYGSTVLHLPWNNFGDAEKICKLLMTPAMPAPASPQRCAIVYNNTNASPSKEKVKTI